MIQIQAAHARQASRPPRVDHNPRRLFSFETGARDAVRTFGVLAWQPQQPVNELCAAEVAFLARIALDRPEAAARGKVTIVGADGLLVLQAADQGGLTSALCGNATAAAVQTLPQARGRQIVIAPDGSRFITDFVRSAEKVEQSWLISPPSVAKLSWRGRTCLRVEGLNTYFVITGDLPDDVPPVIGLRELAQGRPNAKLATLKRGAAAFYNAAGRHGAAPFTGLATLAIASRAVPEVANHLGDRRVTFQTAQGPEACQLPDVGTVGGGRLRIVLPEVEARLTPLSRGAA